MLSYPRLPTPIAEAVLENIRSAYTSGGVDAVRDLVAFDHERKRPVATGRIATPEEIRKVRDAVVAAVQQWVDRGEVNRNAGAEFDNQLGLALHSELSIVPSDAGHDDTWSFLTVVVFPDLAALRFPDLHRDRFLGTSRNALRRPWLRQEVLGDLLQRERGALGEDELVGLFERTALVRNRVLARAVVEAVYAYQGNNRSAWARMLYKLVTFQTGPLMLDVLDEAATQRLVANLAVEANERFDATA